MAGVTVASNCTSRFLGVEEALAPGADAGDGVTEEPEDGGAHLFGRDVV